MSRYHHRRGKIGTATTLEAVSPGASLQAMKRNQSGPGGKRRARSIPDENVIDIARAWFIERTSVRDLAERFGVSESAIRCVIKAEGLYSSPWVDAVATLILEGHSLDRKHREGMRAWR